jgi:pyruvate/2-oxoacid:ferredoxin oxidoreductase alpha subunit
MKRYTSVVDGNEAAAAVANRLIQVIAFYPITPEARVPFWHFFDGFRYFTCGEHDRPYGR